MMVADAALGVDEIVRRPILIVEGAPDRVVVVDRDGIGDLQIGDRLLHVVDALLEGEFGRVHADHDEALVLVLLGPGADVGDGTQAVDAGIGPEVDEHDLALERLRGQRRRVQPLHGAGERRQDALDRQLARLGPLAWPRIIIGRIAASSSPGRRHDDGRLRLASRLGMQPVEQALFERRGARERDAASGSPYRARARSRRRPTSTATPRPRRTHSPAPSERFIAAKTRPPTRSASASEVAAPAA